MANQSRFTGNFEKLTGFLLKDFKNSKNFYVNSDFIEPLDLRFVPFAEKFVLNDLIWITIQIVSISQTA